MSSKIDFKGTDVAFALQDPATALASLFRPVCRGRRPQGLKVFQDFDGFNLMFTCFEGLDTRDQSILLAAIGMAGMQRQTLNAEAPGILGQKLWAGLKPQDMALESNAVALTTTYYALLKAAGLATTGASYERLKEILYRLSQVGCRVKKDGYDWSMHVLSYAAKPDGTLYIALNERFAKAIGGQNARISLDERRQIKGDAAQVLHAWLTAVTRPGCSGLWMGLDAIAVNVWGTAAKGSTARYRRTVLLAAVKEIESLGWKAEQKNIGGGTKHQVKFKRPKIINN